MFAELIRPSGDDHVCAASLRATVMNDAVVLRHLAWDASKRAVRQSALVIGQASGSAVADFSQPFQLAVTGTIDGHLIGGMTFYVAPPSAFGQPIGETGTGVRRDDRRALLPQRPVEGRGYHRR